MGKKSPHFLHIILKTAPTTQFLPPSSGILAEKRQEKEERAEEKYHGMTVLEALTLLLMMRAMSRLSLHCVPGTMLEASHKVSTIINPAE